MSYTRTFPSQEESDRYFEQIKKDREEYYRRSGIDPATLEVPSPPPPRPEILEEFLWALAQMGVEDCIKTFVTVKERVGELVEKRMIEGQESISRENIQVCLCREFLEGGTNNKLSIPNRR